MDGVLKKILGLGPAKLAALAAVLAGSVFFFSFAFNRIGAPEMALLYADLDPKDSGQIVAKLEGMGIQHELRAGGSQIFVPSDKALRLRMSMAEAGLPSGGSIGYEIFDKSDGFGTSSFVQNINHVRALEGELSRTIRSMSQVQSARVHLVLPRRELFARETPEPTASIVLKTYGGYVIDRGKVLAIQQLVAAAVPGLKPQRVTVIDDRGNLLARATAEGNTPELAALETADMRRAFETRLSHSIEELLERTLGHGRVRANVTADMDFDRITTNEERFDPDGQVVRSTQTIEEHSQSSEGQANGQVSVANNLPPIGGAAGGPAGAGENTSRTEESVNYEISRTIKNHVREGGNVKRVSVAVLVDGNYKTAEDGTRTYEARSKEEMEQIAALVRSSIGYDESRGDTVEVVNMPFNDPLANAAGSQAPTIDLSSRDFMRIGEILALVVLGVLILLMVLRPLVNGLLKAGPQLAGATALPPGQTPPALAAPSQSDQMINIDQIEGRVRASSVKKVGEIVGAHPDETVAILRNWMFEKG